MRNAVFILLFWTITVHAQTAAYTFKITGSDKHIDVEKIQSDGKLDIGFYSYHFNLLYQLQHFPEKLFDTSLSSKKIIEWFFDKEPHNYGTNSAYTYGYNAEGRLRSVEYSSCMICNRLPFFFRLDYDAQNRIETIYSRSILYRDTVSIHWPPKENCCEYVYNKELQFFYDKDNSIIKVQHFSPYYGKDELTRQIELVR